MLEDAGPRIPYRSFDGIAISPDGRTIAYVATSTDPPPFVSSIYLKPVDGAAAARVEITNFSGLIDRVAFSSDGRSLALSSGGTFKRVSVGGGAASTICACATGFNQNNQLSWDANDQIIFNRDDTVLRVPAAGGSPVMLLTPRIDQTFFPEGVPCRAAGGGECRAVSPATRSNRSKSMSMKALEKLSASPTSP